MQIEGISGNEWHIHTCSVRISLRGQRQFRVDILNVCGGCGIKLRRGNLGSLLYAVAVHIVLNTNRSQKIARQVGLRRQNRVEICVRDHPSDFFGKEKKRLLACGVVNAGNKNRAAKCSPKIVIAQRRTIDLRAIVEETVGIQNVIPEELVQASVELAGARTCNDVDLAAGTTAILRVKLAPHYSEFFDGVHTRIGE